MAKNKKRRAAAPADPGRVKTTAELPGDGPTPAQRSRRGYRETVDALVVAFVLAFLIRTFQAEAFVIPTGSMAPTLMGRHKDVFCEQCGTRYKINSSDDRNDQVAAFQRAVRNGQITARQAQMRLSGMIAVGGQCPQCRYVMPVSDELPPQLRDPLRQEAEQTADYSGDRLVVSKYAYSFEDPDRWDVAVFKYPGDSETNYIKRVVGLPREELRVFQGDLFVRPLGSDEEFGIARKPPEVVLAMKQYVHDTDHEAARLIEAGWPLAWRGDEGWAVETEEATAQAGAPVVRPTYRGEAAEGETRWLRYHHTPPTEAVWDRVLSGGGEIAGAVEPQLVTDFTAYNTRLNLDQAAENGGLSLRPRRGQSGDLGRVGVHWVGDLLLEADLRIESDAGELSLDLVEAGAHYGVTIDVATGDATLWRRPFEGDVRENLAEAATAVRGPGEHTVRLANVDSRLLLWVDGALVETDAAYEEPSSDAEGDAEVPRASDADAGDLAPAGVGVSGGTVVVDRLRVWRDGYYLATNHRVQNSNFTTDLPPEVFREEDRRRYDDSLLAIASEPELWYVLANRRRVDFPIDEEQLFVMGDNSGWSLDARLWAGGNGMGDSHPGGAYLERKQLVGKAVCVYWPHAWYSVPFTRQKLPAWPNFEDMRLVR